MTSAYLVVVENRVDGVYAFATPELAQRFGDAVEAEGGEALVTEVPVCDAEMAAELVEVEVAS